MFDKKTTENISADSAQTNVPMSVERGGLSASNERDLILSSDGLPARPDGYPAEKAESDLGEPLPVTEVHGEEVSESMSGGYASVKGSRRSQYRIVWLVVAVMTVICIAVGICSSVLTGYFMRRGATLPTINTNGIQQNIAAVVTARKPAIAEISCGGLRGSGVAMKYESGKVYVLTNAHVIETSRSPSVRFEGDDSYYAGEVLGYNMFYDVAVVTVAHDEVYVLDEESFDPNVEYIEGNYVVAIGNAMGMGVAAYDGIISRSYEVLKYNTKNVPVMRTTAAVNAGMSGGALFDMSGNMIGLSTYRMSSIADGASDHSASDDVEDTGFAVPISIVYPVYKQILNYNDGHGGEVGLLDMRYFGTTNTSRTGGIIFADLGFTCEYHGGRLTVTSIDGGSAPRNLAVGDVITHVGPYEITADLCTTAGEFLRYRKNTYTGAKLRLTFERGKDVYSAEYSDIFRYVA